MFQPFKESIPEGSLHREPRIRLGIRRAPACHDIRIPIVTRHLDEAIEVFPWDVGRCEIDRVVSLPNIEGSSVHCDGFNRRRNEKIRISIAVSVRISGQVVWIEKVPDLKVLADRLSMIPGNAGSKILRRFYSSRCGFDGKSRN